MPPESTDASGKPLFAALTLDRGVLTARLVGPSLGQREGPVVAEMIGEQLRGAEPIGYVVLDFTDIEFINSAGLGSCVTIQTHAKKAGKAVVILHALRKELREVFKMTRLDKIFKVADDPKRLAKLTGRK